MNELLQIELNDNKEQVVSGRMLHKFLEVKTAYKDWFPRMCEYGFVENTDFILVAQKRATNNPKNPWTEITDHAIKLDMAKEISMLQRTEKGKQARQYFIEAEKKFKEMSAYQIPKTYSEALMLAAKQQEQLEIQAPKVKYHDTVLDTSSYMTTTEIAKAEGFRSAQELNAHLEGSGVIYRVGYRRNALKPMSAYPYAFTANYVFLLKEGYAKISTHVHQAAKGTKASHSIKWSEKGRKWLHEFITQN